MKKNNSATSWHYVRETIQVIKNYLDVYLLAASAIILAELFIIQLVREGASVYILGSDYVSYLTSSWMLAGGHANAAELYNVHLQSVTQQAILGGRVHFSGGLLPFIAPPYVALFAAPLYYLPLAFGYITWGVLQLSVMLVSLWLLRPLAPPKRPYLLWLMAAAFMPVWESIFEGQLSPLLLLGITILWRDLKTNGSGSWWGGMGLGLCLVKPQVLPIFLLYLLYRRAWRAIGGLLGAATIMYLIGAVYSGFDWPLQYASIISWLQTTPNAGNVPVRMFNLAGLFARFDISISVVFTIVLYAAVVGILIWIWRRCDKAKPPQPVQAQVGSLELQLTAATLATVLIDPHIYLHDLVVLMFSVMVLLNWFSRANQPNWVAWLVILSVPVPILNFVGRIDGLYIALVFVLLLAMLFVARRTNPAPEPPQRRGTLEPN